MREGLGTYPMVTLKTFGSNKVEQSLKVMEALTASWLVQRETLSLVPMLMVEDKHIPLRQLNTYGLPCGILGVVLQSKL